MRIAVIGMGSIGQRHYRNLKKLGYVKVQGWDIDYSKGDPIDWSWRPEVVLVCTPPERHLDAVFDAQRYGVRGLFVEKPLAERWDSRLETALSRAKESDIVTMVGCNWRFRAGVRELLFRPGPLEMSAIIPIPEERRTTKLWDIGIHLVDLAVWSGHRDDFTAWYTYGEPYYVRMDCGNRGRVWNNPKNNSMYLDEMRHFMHCVKTGEPTGNDFSFAAETLKLVREVRDG